MTILDTKFIKRPTSIFVIIVCLSRSCMIPFLTLYLRFLGLSLLEIGLIRGTQIWIDVATSSVWISSINWCVSERCKKLTFSVSVIGTALAYMCLFYIPPPDVRNVTHCHLGSDVVKHYSLSTINESGIHANVANYKHVSGKEFVTVDSSHYDESERTVTPESKYNEKYGSQFQPPDDSIGETFISSPVINSTAVGSWSLPTSNKALYDAAQSNTLDGTPTVANEIVANSADYKDFVQFYRQKGSAYNDNNVSHGLPSNPKSNEIFFEQNGLLPAPETMITGTGRRKMTDSNTVKASDSKTEVKNKYDYSVGQTNIIITENNASESISHSGLQNDRSTEATDVDKNPRIPSFLIPVSVHDKNALKSSPFDSGTNTVHPLSHYVSSYNRCKLPELNGHHKLQHSHNPLTHKPRRIKYLQHVNSLTSKESLKKTNHYGNNEEQFNTNFPYSSNKRQEAVAQNSRNVMAQAVTTEESTYDSGAAFDKRPSHTSYPFALSRVNDRFVRQINNSKNTGLLEEHISKFMNRTEQIHDSKRELTSDSEVRRLNPINHLFVRHLNTSKDPGHPAIKTLQFVNETEQRYGPNGEYLGHTRLWKSSLITNQFAALGNGFNSTNDPTIALVNSLQSMNVTEQRYGPKGEFLGHSQVRRSLSSESLIGRFCPTCDNRLLTNVQDVSANNALYKDTPQTSYPTSRTGYGPDKSLSGKYIGHKSDTNVLHGRTPKPKSKEWFHLHHHPSISNVPRRLRHHSLNKRNTLSHKSHKRQRRLSKGKYHQSNEKSKILQPRRNSHVRPELFQLHAEKDGLVNVGLNSTTGTYLRRRLQSLPDEELAANEDDHESVTGQLDTVYKFHSLSEDNPREGGQQWSTVFWLAYLVVTVCEVCSCVAVPYAELVWQRLQDDTEDESSSLKDGCRPWALLVETFCLLLAPVPCALQLRAHPMAGAALLLPAVILAACVLPTPGTKQRLSRGEALTTCVCRLLRIVEAFVAGLAAACNSEFILLHIDTLAEFPFSYEYLYCGYVALSALVQLPVLQCLSRGDSDSTNDIDDDEEEVVMFDRRHYADNWWEKDVRGATSSVNSRPLLALLAHVTLGLHFLLAPFLRPAWAVALLGAAKGGSDALMGVVYSHEGGWVAGYGVGCFVGGAVASRWGTDFLFWGGAVLCASWSLITSLCLCPCCC